MYKQLIYIFHVLHVGNLYVLAEPFDKALSIGSLLSHLFRTKKALGRVKHFVSKCSPL